MLIREEYPFETHVPDTSDIIIGNTDCVIGCIPTPAFGRDTTFECICVVMLAKENKLIETTISQTFAHMLGMQQRERIPKPAYRKPIYTFYSIALDGTLWTFLRLTGKKLQKSDIFDARTISQSLCIYRYVDNIIKA